MIFKSKIIVEQLCCKLKNTEEGGSEKLVEDPQFAERFPFKLRCSATIIAIDTFAISKGRRWALIMYAAPRMA